jgi:DNA-directed RNA polymerase alpha subunit
MKLQLTYAKIERETEKAALVKVRFGDDYDKTVWFPKSTLEVTGKAIFADTWIIESKERDERRYNPSAPMIATEKPAA